MQRENEFLLQVDLGLLAWYGRFPIQNPSRAQRCCYSFDTITNSGIRSGSSSLQNGLVLRSLQQRARTGLNL